MKLSWYELRILNNRTMRTRAWPDGALVCRGGWPVDKQYNNKKVIWLLLLARHLSLNIFMVTVPSDPVTAALYCTVLYCTVIQSLQLCSQGWPILTSLHNINIHKVRKNYYACPQNLHCVLKESKILKTSKIVNININVQKHSVKIG